MTCARRIFSLGQGLWTIVGISLLLLVFVECFFLSFFLVRDSLSEASPSVPDERVLADAYAEAPWATGYFEEFAQSQIARWEPYVYWRQKPYKGKHINIDEDGRRTTPQLSAKDQSDTRRLRVFMFGGSTLWGTGAPDAMTIPAIVGRELAKQGIVAEVRNYGESGYVNTQELVGLMVALQKEAMPDLVVFYDGVNDTFSAYQQGVAGIPQNEFNRVAEFGVLTPGNETRLSYAAVRGAVRKLATVRFLSGLARRFNLFPQNAPGGAAFAGGVERDSFLIRDVARVYERNVRMTKALGEEFGFSSMFYWQPTVFQKTHRTDYEESVWEGAQHLDSFYRAVYSHMNGWIERSGNKLGVRDLSQAFEGVREPIFIDWNHVGERGNEMIATEMAKDIAVWMKRAKR